MKMLKKILISAMAAVFFLFVLTLILCTGETTVGVNLGIITAVILIGLFITFIAVSNHERKCRGPKL